MSPAALKKENTQLKAELAAAKERLAATETMLRLRKEQDMQLRNSIFEAQRAINASGILPPRMTIPGDINFLKQVSMPVPTLNPGREAQYSRRISELEAELRTVKAENEKNVSYCLCLLWSLAHCCTPETHDHEIPGTMGEAQRISEAQKRGQGCGRGGAWGERENR